MAMMMLPSAAMISFAFAETYDPVVAGPEPVDFDAAEEWCQSQGMELISIHDDAMNDAAMQACLPNSDSTYGCWIGLTQPADKGQGDNYAWKWTDKTWPDYGFYDNDRYQPTLGVAPWFTGTPDDQGENPGENCVRIFVDEQFMWNDVGCDELNLPLCHCVQDVVVTECEQGVNYGVQGVPCVISGDPHTTTWNGHKHDFQGSANGQYYYVSPCAGSGHEDMPFSILGKHTPWKDGSVQGLDYFTFELFDEFGGKFYLFISATLHAYISADDAVDTLYDNNINNPALVQIQDDVETQIGVKFTFWYKTSQSKKGSDEISARLDIASAFGSDCSVEFSMQGQQWDDSTARYMMHAVVITPPPCYRCFSCGICGDFKTADKEMESCFGSTITIVEGWDDDNAFAYDANGNTWEKGFRDANCAAPDPEPTLNAYISCVDSPSLNTSTTTEEPKVTEPPEVYEPELPDDFEFEDPCDPAIVAMVKGRCQTVRDTFADCCAAIESVCDAMQSDCDYDACVSAEGDPANIEDAVDEIFGDAIDMICDIPGIDDSFDDENLIEKTMAPTTGSPTSATTPAPTHPGELTCGSVTSGEYNGEPLQIEVEVPFSGDMTVDLSGSDFDIASITCNDADGAEVTGSKGDDALTLFDVTPNSDYTCTIEGTADAQSGTFGIEIVCSSDSPTASPTTPSPTHPGELICGSITSGEYNGAPLEFEVEMPFEGDMTVDLSGSDFGIASIACYDSDGAEVTGSKDDDGRLLTLLDLPPNTDYSCTFEGTADVQSGTFQIDIVCISDEPTAFPTTPSPTHPGELSCGSVTSGEYNGEPFQIEVQMPFEGDMTVDLSSSDFDIASITCNDADGAEVTGSKGDDSLTLSDVTPNSDYTCIIEGTGDAQSGTFGIEIECTSDSPTVSPTTPSPTQPGELSCGSFTRGVYNGEPFQIEVQMPFNGDLTVDLSGSSFDIASITGYDSNAVQFWDSEGATAPCKDGSHGICALALTLLDVTQNEEYTFIVEGTDYEKSGAFVIDITCSSESPTSSPTDTTVEPSPTSSGTICYSDEECRARQVCDMGTYTCVDPTPSPETPAPTDAPGCCYGDSYKANAKCATASEQDKCESRGCAWMVTDDPSDCEMTTTETPTTTEEVGCCKGDSHKTNSMCNARDTRAKCDRSSSCTFVVGGTIDDECFFPPTAPPEEPGCCYGNPDVHAFTRKWQAQCTKYGTERECLLPIDSDGANGCEWQPMGDYEDCSMLWPTTTTTTEEPGCCMGSSYKAQAKCFGLADQTSCERKDCEWLVTDDDSDCVITTTTTTTTTTTQVPGCCKGSSSASNDKCNDIDDAEKCDRRSSCHFVPFGNVETECAFPPTEPPEDPGCCYGNPDIAYSKRWMEQCKRFYTESECTRLTNGDGDARCAWELLGEYDDCETVWPTTTTTSTPTEEPGCCYGEGSKENVMCRARDSKDTCDRSVLCEWRAGDEADCSYAVEAGCCRGTTHQIADACAKKDERDQCERSEKCEWIVTDDETDCTWPTTTSEPWLGAKAKAKRKSSRLETKKVAHSQTKKVAHSQTKNSHSKKAQHHQEKQEKALFGAGIKSVMELLVKYQVSLSTVFLASVAVLAVLQLYRWWSRRHDGYSKLQAPQGHGSATYQSV